MFNYATDAVALVEFLASYVHMRVDNSFDENFTFGDSIEHKVPLDCKGT